MKRILVVSNMYPNKKFPSYGIFVKNFCKQLSDLGYDIDISVITKTQSRILKIAKYIKFYMVTFYKSLFGNFDLVYIHYPSFSSAPVNLARKVRKFEVISNVHGTDVVPLKAEHEKMIINTKIAIDNSKMVVVPSEYFKQLVIEKYNLDGNRIFVYPSGGVNDSIFYSYDEDEKEKIAPVYGIEKDSFVIGYVSRINKAKGWDIFIEAIKKSTMLKKKNIKIFIVGSGEDDDLLNQEILSLPEYLNKAIIRFPLLNQQKLSDIYNMLDVFIFPTISASESLGLVAIEAMSCGVPVIASDFAAPAYYIQNGVNGMKFRVKDSNELAIAIDAYCSLSIDQKETLKRGAIETARKYSSHSIEQGLKDIL